MIIKGGHLPTADIVDLLFDGADVHRVPSRTGAWPHTHGTGCTFAAALAAHLALRPHAEEAIPLAQAYVAGAIRHAPDSAAATGRWTTSGRSIGRLSRKTESGLY